ncbi:MAG: PIN domain-containing protein [Acidobacteria bacterium]|nr:PIN domain-containing protein [Acidobacteriota bacterium]
MFLLDTHVFWWLLAEPERLSASHAVILDQAEAEGSPLQISCYSLWELGQMAARGRILPPEPLHLWLPSIDQDPDIVVHPLTGAVAADAVQLSDRFPKDPGDRIIAATARVHGLTLLTADWAIRKSDEVPVA